MKFRVINNNSEILECDVFYLRYSHYDDYGYCTSYKAYAKSFVDGSTVEFGTVKIGCRSLNSKVGRGTSQNGFASYSINDLIPKDPFNKLTDEFFSLGQNVYYYKEINNYFKNRKEDVYTGIKDLAYYFSTFEQLYEDSETCLINSLMRNIHYPNVEQFNRIIKGDAELTPYDFRFNYCNNTIDFNVDPDWLPPTNIHVLIGRNGVGKTWLLYHMVCRILETMDINVDETESTKYNLDTSFVLDDIRTRFAGVISMSFSIFDDGFSSIKLAEINTNNKQEKLKLQDDFIKKYKYIGLINNRYIGKDTKKDQKEETVNVCIKTVKELSQEFISYLNKIGSDTYITQLYMETCKNLNSDTMFSDNGFINLLETFFHDNCNNTTEIVDFFKKLSSGHMIIILSLTALCASISEKTIVFIDEPETHLHPPLLATYIRTLSFLLRKRNAIAIIATHSPIVLQEVPKSCVTKVERIKNEMHFFRPETETFASGTDQLTREIFGYELLKTGFYKLLKKI